VPRNEVPGRQPTLYSWPGVLGRGPVRPPINELGPDTRASPEGVLPNGRTADVVLFFDIPADKLQRFVLDATFADTSSQRLGEARLAFAR
jgi:hypothetical protein